MIAAIHMLLQKLIEKKSLQAIKKELSVLFLMKYKIFENFKVLTFTLEKKTKVELDTLAIKFSIYDKNRLGRDTLLGIYELDVTSIYFSYQHEYYRVWMAVTDPTDTVEGSTGFINATITVLGPDDELPVNYILFIILRFMICPQKKLR